MAPRGVRGAGARRGLALTSAAALAVAALASCAALLPRAETFILPAPSPAARHRPLQPTAVRTRALREEGIEWSSCGAPDFYAFADRLTASSGKWEGEVLAWTPKGGDVQSQGTVRVGFEEVMRACGGAVAGVAEAVVASDSSIDGEVYGLCEHNRGDDGFLFAEDGAFSHGPETLPTSEEAWEIVTSLIHPAHPMTRLRARLTLQGPEAGLVGLSWSWEALGGGGGEVVSGQEEQRGAAVVGVRKGRVLRAKRGAGPTPQFLRARASWQEAEAGVEYDVGCFSKDSDTEALARQHGLLVRVARAEGGDAAVRADVGGLFAGGVVAWTRVYDAPGPKGGNLREVFLFRS